MTFAISLAVRSNEAGSDRKLNSISTITGTRLSARPAGHRADGRHRHRGYLEYSGYWHSGRRRHAAYADGQGWRDRAPKPRQVCAHQSNLHRSRAAEGGARSCSSTRRGTSTPPRLGRAIWRSFAANRSCHPPRRCVSSAQGVQPHRNSRTRRGLSDQGSCRPLTQLRLARVFPGGSQYAFRRRERLLLWGGSCVLF